MILWLRCVCVRILQAWWRRILRIGCTRYKKVGGVEVLVTAVLVETLLISLLRVLRDLLLRFAGRIQH